MAVSLIASFINVSFQTLLYHGYFSHCIIHKRLFSQTNILLAVFLTALFMCPILHDCTLCDMHFAIIVFATIECHVSHVIIAMFFMPLFYAMFAIISHDFLSFWHSYINKRFYCKTLLSQVYMLTCIDAAETILWCLSRCYNCILIWNCWHAISLLTPMISCWHALFWAIPCY